MSVEPTEVSQTRDGSTRIVYRLTDPIDIQNYLSERNFPAEFEASEIMIVMYMPREYELDTPSSSFLKITEVSDWWFFPDNPFRTSSYVYPGTQIIVSESVAATWSCTVTVSSSFLTTALGYSHSNARTVSDSQNVSVPQGRRAYVSTYAYHRRTAFEVWNNGIFGSQIFQGTGSSLRPNGVRFEVVYGNE